MDHHQRSYLLQAYFLSSFLVIVGLSAGFVEGVSVHDLRTGFFVTATLLSSSFFYLLPALLLSKAVHVLLRSGFGRSIPALKRWASGIDLGVAVLAVALVEMLLFADRTVFALFGFHINGFVLNLVATPGGIESMGTGRSAMLVYALGGVGLLAAQIVVLFLLHRLLAARMGRGPLVSGRAVGYGLLAMAMLILSEKVTYAMSQLEDFQEVLVAAQVFPLYQPLTIKHLAKRMGLKVKRRPGIVIDDSESRLNYPLQPLEVKAVQKPLNIVWLAAESWRADMLDPEIMPATWQFAKTSHRFTNHYSGGNGTRMGLFSMFYGLYGSYWFSFLAENRPPVIMDVLQDQGYQLSLYTSAKFSYPEFDKTIFAGVPANSLHPHQEDLGWRSDRYNVGKLLSFLENRDQSRPFMAFMFFESAHARYYFPEESVIRRPYLEDLNYATMSLDKDMPAIRNRYINSCHHLDSQLARVFTYLREHDLLDSTVVIVTGDHGEEFMEKGRWGHNSEFHEEQVRVPLLIRLPGGAASESGRMTSHLDIVPTIMPLLGVQNDSRDYSLGFNLLGPKQRRYTIICDWSRACYVDGQFKAVIPMKTSRMLGSQTTTRNDAPLADGDRFYQSHRETLHEVMERLAQFKMRSAS